MKLTGQTVTVSVLFVLSVASLEHHASTARMVPPSKDNASGGFNPVHFSVLCLTLLTLRVRCAQSLALLVADCTSSSMWDSRALHGTFPVLGTLASHTSD
jgi:hypothetical protein